MDLDKLYPEKNKLRKTAQEEKEEQETAAFLIEMIENNYGRGQAFAIHTIAIVRSYGVLVAMIGREEAEKKMAALNTLRANRGLPVVMPDDDLSYLIG